jgi:cobalamin biosynthetic protein CobC
LAPEPWIDLSTGINPLAYPMPALLPEDLTRLPEPQDEQRLLEIAAGAYGVADPAMVAAAPGTQILISLLPLLAPARRVAVVQPTYGEHAAAWANAGAAVRAIDDPALCHAGETVVLCQPNNPDGRYFDADGLVALAGRLAAEGGLLVVDEAFADLEDPRLTVAPALPCAGLVVLRSFGKTYGLAGVRLGFLLADVAFAARVRAALGPWAVSGPALRVGTAALADSAWREVAAAWLRRDSARLDALLERAGLRVVGGTCLFRLAETPQAGAWHERLGAAGLLVRHFSERPHWLRLGVPPPAEAAWRRLEACLRSGLGPTLGP